MTSKKRESLKKVPVFIFFKLTSMLMRVTVFFASLFFSFWYSHVAFALPIDCAKVKPFKPYKKFEHYKIEASQLFWKSEGATQTEESKEICSVDGKILAYDIRGREEEAFYCLKADKDDIYTCDTTLNGNKAKIFFLPAIWVRNWKPKDAREYRFHAVVQADGKPSDYVDIFARTLSFNIKAADIVTEGAVKNGPTVAKEGFFIRATFTK